MIFITGDKHGQIEYFLHNPSLRKIKKGDLLIVCGDFGFLWDSSDQEYKKLKWLSKRRFNIAFVDGCFDNMRIIEKYPISSWNGGKVRTISNNIFYLIKGEVYKTQSKKFLAFGGGFNSNISDVSDINNNWWPNKEENVIAIDSLIKNIEKENGEFDFIVSHEAPSSLTPCLENTFSNVNSINLILEEIRTHCKFKKWFFGKYHVDKQIPPKYNLVFEKIVKA